MLKLTPDQLRSPGQKMIGIVDMTRVVVAPSAALTAHLAPLWESGTFAGFANDYMRFGRPVTWESNVPWEARIAVGPQSTHHPCCDSFSCLTDGVHLERKTVSRETRGEFHCYLRHMTRLIA